MMLPVCLLWAFVACVSLCLAQDEDAEEHVAISQGIDAAHESGCCPVIEATTSLLPERSSFVSRADIALPTIHALSARTENDALCGITESAIPPSTASPFQRLRVLRI